MHLTHNTLSQNIRAQSVELLNKHLAAAIDLHGQLKHAHWNVRGPNFIAIHELFDKVAVTALEAADLIAERAAGLGGTAYGTVQTATGKSFLVPYALGVADEAKHVFAVSAALAAFGQSIREAVGTSTTLGDTTTADLYTEIGRGVDQQLWFVESHRVPEQQRSLIANLHAHLYPAEKAQLASLADKLGLDPDLVAHFHAKAAKLQAA